MTGTSSRSFQVGPGPIVTTWEGRNAKIGGKWSTDVDAPGCWSCIHITRTWNHRIDARRTNQLTSESAVCPCSLLILHVFLSCFLTPQVWHGGRQLLLITSLPCAPCYSRTPLNPYPSGDMLEYGLSGVMGLGRSPLLCNSWRVQSYIFIVSMVVHIHKILNNLLMLGTALSSSSLSRWWWWWWWWLHRQCRWQGGHVGSRWWWWLHHWCRGSSLLLSKGWWSCHQRKCQGGGGCVINASRRHWHHPSRGGHWSLTQVAGWWSCPSMNFWDCVTWQIT